MRCNLVDARAAVGADLDILARGEPRLRAGYNTRAHAGLEDAFRLATGDFIAFCARMMN